MLGCVHCQDSLTADSTAWLTRRSVSWPQHYTKNVYSDVKPHTNTDQISTTCIMLIFSISVTENHILTTTTRRFLKEQKL